MEEVPVALASWAVGPGLPVVAQATALLDEGRDALAVGTTLRGALPPDRAAFAVAAAETRRRARAAGVPHADLLVLTREALEQASDPAVAAWRAARAGDAAGRAGGAGFVDLCTGTGADAVALAAHGHVDAVEADPGRAVLARHRAEVLGADVTVHVGDALAPPVPLDGRVVHADPDRRDATGRRARTLAQHRPPVDALLRTAGRAAGALVTVRPGLALDDPALPAEGELAFLQVEDRLVEAVVCVGAAADRDVAARAVLLPGGWSAERHRGEDVVPEVAELGTHLLVPAPAVVRARLHDRLGAEVGAWRVAGRSALLTGDAAVDAPWCRSEPVLGTGAARGRAVRELLAAHPDRRVELLLHGVQVDPAAFLRSAGRPPTGPDDLGLHLVRRDDDAIAVLTDRRG